MAVTVYLFDVSWMLQAFSSSRMHASGTLAVSVLAYAKVCDVQLEHGQDGVKRAECDTLK